MNKVPVPLSGAENPKAIYSRQWVAAMQKTREKAKIAKARVSRQISNSIFFFLFLIMPLTEYSQGSGVIQSDHRNFSFFER